jgi:hypothetical protein
VAGNLSIACALFFFICSREIQQLHRSVPTLRWQIQVGVGAEHCFVASPQRGEMFIAWRFFFYSEAP